MKDFIRLYWAPVVIVVLGIAVALMFVAPAPPKKVKIAGGAEGGAYAGAAVLYADALRKKDIEVEVLTTQGSVDNLDMIKTKKADIGIVPIVWPVAGFTTGAVAPSSASRHPASM